VKLWQVNNSNEDILCTAVKALCVTEHMPSSAFTLVIADILAALKFTGFKGIQI